MKRHITASIARKLSPNATPETVHFHLDSDGRPFVCDVDRCESPSLSSGEVAHARK